MTLFNCTQQGHFALMLLIVFILISPTPAKSQNIASKKRDVQTLEHNEKSFRAYVDARKGTPEWILDVDSLDFGLGVRRSWNTEAAVKKGVRDFLSAHSDVFNINPGHLKFVRVHSNERFWFISLQQQYNEVPIVNAEVGVTITPTGKLIAAGVRAFPEISVDTSPQISAQSAVQMARASLGSGNLSVTDDKTELVILPVELEERYDFRLAWQFSLENDDFTSPVNQTFYIDAKNGELIEVHDNVLSGAMHEAHRPPTLQVEKEHFLFKETISQPPFFSGEQREVAIEGNQNQANSVWGYVKLNYYESPDDYTGPLDRFTNKAFFNAKITVTNNSTQQSSTTYANASGYYSISGLSSGAHTVTFTIENQKARIVSGVVLSKREKDIQITINGSTRCDYDWNWGDDGDGGRTSVGLNAVYHVREMYDYIKGLGYSGMDGTTTQLTITDDAGSTANQQQITVGGLKGMSSEVTYHEYAHDIIYSIYNGWIRSGQSGQTYLESNAMDEGFADYFAADKTNDQAFGGPQQGADPAANPNHESPIRLKYNSCTMNDFNSVWPCGGTSHSRGNIVSGAIWRIRIAIGSSTATDLLLDALQMSPLPHTFEDLRDRYEAADGGSNASAIEQKFTDRFIGGPIAPGTLTLSLNGADNPVLNWTDKSSVEDGYRVEYKQNSGSWSTLANLSAGSQTFTHYNPCKGGGSGTDYYRIQAYYQNPGNPDETSYSNQVALPLADCGVAKAPPQITPELVIVEEIPDKTELLDAYPNPFNPTATIEYALSEKSFVTITVYDLLGRTISVLVNQVREAGRYSTHFDAEGLPSGLYVYRMETDGYNSTNTMLLTK